MVRGHWGTAAGGVPAPYPRGAGLRPATPGDPAYVLVDGAEERSLGGVLAWALRFGAGDIHLLADASDQVAAILARRAQAFALPITVWAVDPPRLREVAPGGYFPMPPVPAEAMALADVLRAAGADPVVEFGVLSGEVLGLEVARVVDGQLEVGVGVQDRASHRDLEPDRPIAETLAEVVAVVRRFRRPDAPAHLANSLSGERWLRQGLVARPDLVGAAWLAPMPPAVARRDLRVPSAAMATGVDVEGRPVVVAASTGIDLDLVPAAADARRAAGLEPGARLLLAIPPADDHPRTRQLAGSLHQPAEVMTVPTGWKALADTL
ncbi:MAG TPA: hypothetical protein VHT30_10250 [Acidimicrobiales bacterium]|nr:hypothetical protein [Acidimicrobiales bacterium]